jgi:hypothetical protein
LILGHQEIEPNDVNLEELRWKKEENKKEEAEPTEEEIVAELGYTRLVHPDLNSDDFDNARDAIIKRRRIERSKQPNGITLILFNLLILIHCYNFCFRNRIRSSFGCRVRHRFSRNAS